MNFSIEKVKPETKQELKDLIYETIEKYGIKCDLNFIDTSEITDMSHLFTYDGFNGDISKWDVSNVTNMYAMFIRSRFKGNIDDWKVNPNCDTERMFVNSELEKNSKLPKWYK